MEELYFFDIIEQGSEMINGRGLKSHEGKLSITTSKNA